MDDAMSALGSVSAVDDPSLEALLLALSRLIRTVASPRRGVDEVMADLGELAGQLDVMDGMYGLDRLDHLDRVGGAGVAHSAEDAFADLATSCLALAQERARLARVTDALEYRATHDELTGLPNRSVLLDRLEHALLAEARGHSLVAVMFIDIDGFKDINDTLGHPFGDLVLASVARRLAEALRAGDTVGRLGGDEFLVICENLTGPPAAIDLRLRALGRRLLRRVGTAEAGGTEVVVSVSIGVAVGGHRDDAQGLIRDADRAMYRAKALGGGQFVLAESPMVPLAGLRVTPIPRSAPLPRSLPLRVAAARPGRRRHTESEM